MDYHENKFLLQLNQENWKRLQNPNTKQPLAPLNPLAFDRYSYAFNNPVRYTDPDGHNPLLLILALVGAFIFFSQVPSDVYQPDPADQGDPVVMGVGAVMMAPQLVGSMLCGDGDCTNEVNSIDFVTNQSLKVEHIMETKHAWGRLINTSGDVTKDYQAVQSIIQAAIKNGTSSQINVSPQGDPIMQFLYTINGETVVVRAIQLANGVLEISDAWVKTK